MQVRVITSSAVAAVVCCLGGAALATAADHGGGPSYKGSGQSSYAKTGQACFGARWQGTGGWTTKYKLSAPAGQGDNVTDDEDASNYSWDLSEATSGAACALELLRAPGSKPVGGASWNRGYTRIGANGHDTFTEAGNPPMTTTCSHGIVEHADAGAVAGEMTIKTRGSGIIFELTLGLPQDSCGAYSRPGLSVPGGQVGSFLTADSAVIPRSVFEKDGNVSITVSSDSTQGGRPNCGVKSVAPAMLECSQTGAWQGTLTLYQG